MRGFRCDNAASLLLHLDYGFGTERVDKKHGQTQRVKGSKAKKDVTQSDQKRRAVGQDEQVKADQANKGAQSKSKEEGSSGVVIALINIYRSLLYLNCHTLHS